MFICRMEMGLSSSLVEVKGNSPLSKTAKSTKWKYTKFPPHSTPIYGDNLRGEIAP